jgi:hypothetical protein
VKAFFENILDLMARHNFTANKICNSGETVNSTVQVSPKIICAKGIMQVGIVTLGERVINVKMFVDVNAIGNHIPPMLIFARVHFKNDKLTGASTVSIGGANPAGWSN